MGENNGENGDGRDKRYGLGRNDEEEMFEVLDDLGVDRASYPDGPFKEPRYDFPCAFNEKADVSEKPAEQEAKGAEERATFGITHEEAQRDPRKLLEIIRECVRILKENEPTDYDPEFRIRLLQGMTNSLGRKFQGEPIYKEFQQSYDDFKEVLEKRKRAPEELRQIKRKLSAEEDAEAEKRYLEFLERLESTQIGLEHKGHTPVSMLNYAKALGALWYKIEHDDSNNHNLKIDYYKGIKSFINKYLKTFDQAERKLIPKAFLKQVGKTRKELTEIELREHDPEERNEKILELNEAIFLSVFFQQVQRKTT